MKVKKPHIHKFRKILLCESAMPVDKTDRERETGRELEEAEAGVLRTFINL